MKNKTTKKILVLTVFSIAMGLLESSVVIYLRELYYPEGFKFPIKLIPSHISIVELNRELATIIMLWGIAFVCGKTKLQRLAYFCLAFAIWDICYYVFLYVFISWPESIFTWDLLFLLPYPWVGPVWAPLLISFLMLISSVIYLKKIEKDSTFQIKKKYLIMLITGAFVCILSFMWDYFQLTNFNLNIFDALSSSKKSNFIYKYIPEKFNALLFFLGFGTMLIAVLFQFINPLKTRKDEKK